MGMGVLKSAPETDLGVRGPRGEQEMALLRKCNVFTPSSAECESRVMGGDTESAQRSP